MQSCIAVVRDYCACVLANFTVLRVVEHATPRKVTAFHAPTGCPPNCCSEAQVKEEGLTRLNLVVYKRSAIFFHIIVGEPQFLSRPMLEELVRLEKNLDSIVFASCLPSLSLVHFFVVVLFWSLVSLFFFFSYLCLIFFSVSRILSCSDDSSRKYLKARAWKSSEK